MTITATRIRGMSGKIGEGLKTTAEVPYLITGAPAGSSLLSILSADGLPAYGSIGHGGYVIGARVEEWQDAKGDGSGAWGIVTVEYGPWPSKNGDPSQQDPNPLNRPASITWGTVESIEPLDEDQDGKAPVNTLGDPLDPRPEEPVVRLSITVRRYVDPSEALRTRIVEFVNHVNQGSFWGFPQDAVLCRAITEEEQWEGRDENGNPVHCVQQTIVFEVDEDRKWLRKGLNRGGRYKDEQGNIVAVKDDHGVATGEVVLLNEDGTRFVQGEDEPYYITLRTKARANFGDLDLPDPT